MKFTFETVKFLRKKSGAWLCLKPDTPIDMSFFGNKKYVAEIKEYHPKRTLDQNAYFWLLCGKLAEKLSVPQSTITKDMIYREYIRDVGDNYVIHPHPQDDIDSFKRWWCDGHIGRYVEDLGECKNIKGYHNLRCYISSSEYDTKQMSRLIDLIRQDCLENGIEVDERFINAI